MSRGCSQVLHQLNRYCSGKKKKVNGTQKGLISRLTHKTSAEVMLHYVSLQTWRRPSWQSWLQFFCYNKRIFFTVIALGCCFTFCVSTAYKLSCKYDFVKDFQFHNCLSNTKYNISTFLRLQDSHTWTLPTVQNRQSRTVCQNCPTLEMSEIRLCEQGRLTRSRKGYSATVRHSDKHE